MSKYLGKVDLNLLPVLASLLDTRNVTPTSRPGMLITKHRA
jgi:hypothetical protein